MIKLKGNFLKNYRADLRIDNPRVIAFIFNSSYYYELRRIFTLEIMDHVEREIRDD